MHLIFEFKNSSGLDLVKLLEIAMIYSPIPKFLKYLKPFTIMSV